MITYKGATILRLGDEIHYGECLKTVGPRGGLQIAIDRWRVKGSVEGVAGGEWSLLIAQGSRDYKQLTQHNAYLFHVGSRCIVKEAQ